MSYDIQSLDMEPTISEFYSNIEPEFKLSSPNLDTRYLGERTLAVLPKLISNFELYYETREIGGESEYDFFNMLQSCLNRNADTYERQLEVYDDDIAKPILGRTEIVTYNTQDKRDSSLDVTTTYGGKNTRTEGGNDVQHHVEVPADEPEYDTDRTRDKTDYGHTQEDATSGQDSQSTEDDETRRMTGTVTTELSDLGVRPNYESLNGFLDNNRSYIQFFIETFEKCFAPRYKRVYF